MTHRTIKGTHDILPEDSVRWQKLERVIMTLLPVTATVRFAHLFLKIQIYFPGV